MRATFGRYLPLIGVVCGILSPYALGDTLLVPSQYATIQGGINAAVPGDTVLVADGTYTGAGNKDLDFGGKDITVQSASGNAATCVIDCEQSGRGFYFHSGETGAAGVAGFTIRNGKVTTSSPGSYYGGGVYCSSTSRPTLTNCTFSGNSATGGGGLFNSGGNPVLTNCTFSGNSALGNNGGGLYNDSGNPVLTNCTFIENSVSAAAGGGMFNLYGNASLTNCTFSSNSVFGAGSAGGLYNNSGSATLTNCTFSSNSAHDGGGLANDGTATLTNCTFSSNSALVGGGGMYNNVTATLTNCTFSGNSASSGGGLRNNATATLTNCTFSGNSASASGYGGGIYNGSSLTLGNCIVWGNTAPSNSQIAGSATVTYSCVQGGWSGTGNISTNPLFVNGASGNLRLEAGSPCIDAGNYAAVPSAVTTDLGGNPRFADDPDTADTGSGTPPIVDMGAYEVPFLRGDLNCDGRVDFDDINPFVAALVGREGYEGAYPDCLWFNGDCNGDGTVNFNDINPFVTCLVGGGCP